MLNKISLFRKTKMGGDDKKEIKEGNYCSSLEEAQFRRDFYVLFVLTCDASQGVRVLLAEEGEVEVGEAFTGEEVVVVEEEEAELVVEVTMEEEGEVLVVVAVSTGELSRYLFRASSRFYFVG